MRKTGLPSLCRTNSPRKTFWRWASISSNWEIVPKNDSLTGYRARPRRRFYVCRFRQRLPALAWRGAGGEGLRPRTSNRSGRSERANASALSNVMPARRFTLLWSDGSVSLVAAELNPQFDDLGRRIVKHALQNRASLPPEGKEIPLQAIAPQVGKRRGNVRQAVCRTIASPCSGNIRQVPMPACSTSLKRSPSN